MIRRVMFVGVCRQAKPHAQIQKCVDGTVKSDRSAIVLPSTRSTQPCIPPGSLNRVPASAGVRAGMLRLPAGR